MNNWSFTGNLGRAAELRYTQAGDAVASFTVAVKSGYGNSEHTTWPKCTLWGKRAEALAKFLGKGQKVAIVGEVSLRDFETRDGQKGKSLEVRVNEIDLMGKRDDAAGDPPQDHESSGQTDHGRDKANGYAPQENQKPSFDDLGDDIPFN